MSDVWFGLRNESSSVSRPPSFYTRGFSSILSKRDSSTSLGEEEILEVEDSTSSKIVIQEQSSFQFEGVRFTPKVIEFNDAFDGKQFYQKIELQNVGRNPVLVKIGVPNSFVFHMNKHDRTAKLLSSGRSIKRTLSYVYHNNHLVLRSQIRVQINGRCIDYPIIVRRAQPAIEVRPPELDFKVINMGASAKTLKLTLINSGGKGTKFAIDLGRNELDLVVNPPRGTIRAKSQMSVYVEMVGLTEGEFYREMWITTSERPIRVPIIAEVMRPRLEVYHPNATGDFTLINFPPTFRGTQRVDSIVLRNFSADMTPFAIFAEIGGELKGCNEARKFENAFQMFTMSAEEGRLEPFESRIVTISFKPLRLSNAEGWHHRKVEDNKRHLTNEFLVFFRINRVHCIERHELERSDADQKTENAALLQKELDKRQSIMLSVASFMAIPGFGPNVFESATRLFSSDDNSFSNQILPAPIEDKDVVRLCLHGAVCEPDLLVQPDILLFENCLIGMTKTKVLKLINQSPIEMMFKYLKVVNITMKPSSGWLQPKQAVDVEILYKPTFQGKIKNAINIELFGKSAILYDCDKDLVSMKVLKVCFTAVVATPVPPRPGIHSGISCPLTNELGVRSELIGHGLSHPKVNGGTLDVLPKKTKLHLTNGAIDNAVATFPTNLPHRSASKVCRSILVANYRDPPPPGENQTLNRGEMNMNFKILNDYLDCRRGTKSYDDPKFEPCVYDFIRREISDRKKLQTIDKTKQEECSLQIKSLTKKGNVLSKLVLIPLSPIFLSNIKVEPKLIDFAMVAPNAPVTETLKLHNMNSFPVSVRFVPGKSGVTLPDGDIRLIPPMGKKLLRVVFKTKDSGRYNGFLDYVINGSHMFKITVSANVVPRTLIIPDSDLNIDLGNYLPSAAFQPNSSPISLINNLRSSIKFHWEMQSDSAFYIEPISGEVPAMASLMSYVYFSLHPEKSTCAEANLVSESGTTQPVKLTYKKTKSNVYFSVNKIELNQIALNLPETVNARLMNENYYDVAFEVIDCSPIPGIKISPRQGIIKTRCFYDLQVEIKIPVIIDFQFDLRVRIQNGPSLSLKVHGVVVFPMVKVTPLEVTMRKISVQSFDVASIWIENIGTTPFRVEINLKEYPEYRISKTKNKMIEDLEEGGIYLSPKKSCKVFLHFEPKDIARYQFYLPLVINGILGPPLLQDSLTENVSFYLDKYESSYLGFGRLTRSSDMQLKIPCACINCTVVGHYLKFSTMNVVFQRQANREAVAQEVEIKNIHSSPVTICIRTDDVNNPFTPFKLEVLKDRVENFAKALKLDLQVGETVILKAMFSPRKAGLYTVEIPVFLRGYNDGYAYNIITLAGESRKATIFAEAREIHFPPLPPRIGNEVIMQVFAERYTTPEILSCNVLDMDDCGKPITDFIKILWLDEPKITGTKDFQSFSVQISFQSNSAVSLRTFLVFSDGRSEYFPVLLTAATDKCSITNHLFLSTRSTKYKLMREEMNTGQTDEEAYYAPRALPKHRLLNTTYRKDVKKHRGKTSNPLNDHGQTNTSGKTDPGPKLVVQTTKSMQRLTQLNFVWLEKTHEHHKITNEALAVFSRVDVLSDSTKSSLKTGKGMCEAPNDITFPNFPNCEESSYYEKHLRETLNYVELWVYEVVFHCEEYMVIPYSFQMGGVEDEWARTKSNKEQKWEVPKKTVVDLVVALVGANVRKYFPDRSLLLKDPPARAEYMYSVFNCLLNFLAIQGSFLPHVRPEILLSYQDYLLFLAKRPICEPLKCNARYDLKNPLLGFGQNHPSCLRNSMDDYQDIGQSSLLFNETWSKPNYVENYEDNGIGERKYGDQEENGLDGILTGGRRAVSSDYEAMKDYRFKHKELDEKSFNSRSTQAWLDVILQIYRTLMLPKVVYRKVTFSAGLSDFEETFNAEIFNSFSTFPMENHKRNGKESLTSSDVSDSNIYTNQERILLAWLKHHYDLQRTILWPNNSTNEMGKTPPPRNVDSFRTDLTDSLVLMAVTASYCPYLIPNYFVDVFHMPENQEQIYHNAIKLTSAWREVNIALTVEPKDIVHSNSVFMLMIVCHLYEILPLLCPRSLIRFTAPLTEGMTKSIELFNKLDEKVIYEAKFIGLQEGSFKLINNPTIVLRPKKIHDFKISYRAKRVHKVSVTLLLDGAYVSPNFAKSMVFQLEGEPSELTEYSKINLQGFLYKVICMEIPIVSPYPEETNYEISYSTYSPRHSDPKLLEMKPWRDIWNRKTSRRLFINQSHLAYHENSQALLSVTIACLTIDPRKFWLLFHSEIGDFIVRIEVMTKYRESGCSPISMVLPNLEKEGFECTCTDIRKTLVDSGTQTCPFLLYLRVPSRNCYLWDTMFTMFQKTLEPKEKMFWKQHFETNIGIRLIKWLLSQDESPEVTDEFVPSLRTNVTYNVKIDSNAEQYVSVAPTIEIPDVRLREPVYLPIHISNHVPNDLKVTLTMTSENKKEIRIIKYAFERGTEEDGNSKSSNTLCDGSK